MSMKLYENIAYKISSKQLTIVLKLQLRVTKFMLIVNNVQFKKWLSSSPSSYSHFYVGSMYDDIRLHVARSDTPSADSPLSLISSFTLSNHLS